MKCLSGLELEALILHQDKWLTGGSGAPYFNDSSNSPNIFEILLVLGVIFQIGYSMKMLQSIQHISLKFPAKRA